MRREGVRFEDSIETVPVPTGLTLLKDQIGCVPLGAAIVTLIRDPAR
jgi:hypothetical protein